MCRDGWIQGSDMKGTLNPDASSRTNSPPRFYRLMRSLVLLETSRLLFILVLLFLFLFLFSRGILLLFLFCLCRHFFPFLFCFFSWSLLPPTRLIYSVFFPLRCHSQLPAFCLPPPTSSLFTLLLASPFFSILFTSLFPCFSVYLNICLPFPLSLSHCIFCP